MLVSSYLEAYGLCIRGSSVSVYGSAATHSGDPGATDVTDVTCVTDVSLVGRSLLLVVGVVNHHRPNCPR